MDEGYVLVVGAAGIDVKGRPDEEIDMGASNVGIVRNSVGGTARNIAENLARLEVDTVLLTAVGDDEAGDRVLGRTEDADVDCAHVRIVEGGRTGTYLAVLNPDGDLSVAVSDFAVMKHVDDAYLREREELFADADMVVTDATLTEVALRTVFEFVDKYELDVCVDPTSPGLAGRICDYISQIYFIIPNAKETKVLCGLAEAASDRDSAIDAARTLVTMGSDIAVVTLGEQGLAYADGSGSGFIRAVKTHIVDSTGAGDAFSGAAIFGLLNDMDVDEAMRLGATAAALTLGSRETVLPQLSQELLYNQLVV